MKKKRIYVLSFIKYDKKIILSELLTQEKIIQIFKKNKEYSEINQIILNNIFNDSESQYSFSTNTINEYEYYTVQFLDSDKIGSMTNFIYDLILLKIIIIKQKLHY